jgi:hypothetical protein
MGQREMEKRVRPERNSTAHMKNVAMALGNVSDLDLVGVAALDFELLVHRPSDLPEFVKPAKALRLSTGPHPSLDPRQL